jgi:hypothetical protein
MKQWFANFYKNNKAISWAAIVAVIITLGVLIKVKDEVTRFTLIMPVFAGFILFSILITPDEAFEDEEKKIDEKPKRTVTVARRGRKSKRK